MVCLKWFGIIMDIYFVGHYVCVRQIFRENYIQTQIISCSNKLHLLHALVTCKITIEKKKANSFKKCSFFLKLPKSVN